MTLDISREFKLDEVITANNLIERLINSDTAWTFRDLYATLSALENALDKGCFDQTLKSTGGRRFLVQLDNLHLLNTYLEDKTISESDANLTIADDLASLRQWINSLQGEFKDELTTIPVYLPEIPRPEIETWYSIEGEFGTSADFRLLPLATRDSFKQAGHCFLFKQYTACAVMAMRAAEAMLRECYYRIKLEKPGDQDTWGTLSNGLTFKDPLLPDLLKSGGKQRNELMHARRELVQNSAGNAQDFFNSARLIVHRLMQELQNDNKALAVAICLERSSWLSLDILTALWLLNRYKRGIGRLVFIDVNDPEIDKPGDEEYDYLLGIGSKRFELFQGTSYAREIAKDLVVEKKHPRLLDYCTRWLAAQSENRPFDETAVYEQTFEGIIEATQTYYRPRDKKPELWIKRVFSVFDQVRKLKLDPSDPTLLTKLKTKQFDDAIAYWRHIRQKETALKEKKDINYLGLRGLVTRIDAVEFESFAHMAFEQGYQLVALTDGIQAFWIKTNTTTTSLSSIVRRLRSKVGNLDSLDTHKRTEVRQKRSVRLSVDELYSCMEPD